VVKLAGERHRCRARLLRHQPGCTSAERQRQATRRGRAHRFPPRPSQPVRPPGRPRAAGRGHRSSKKT